MSAPVIDGRPAPLAGGRRRSLARRLLICVALGGLLLAGKRIVAPPASSPPALVVVVPTGADADAIRRASIDAVLIDEALRARWPLADPVVRERLLDVMRAGGAASTHVARALAPGLPATDPATRARLAWIGRELIRARVSPRAPTAAELAAYQAAHPARYAPDWLAFRQHTISRARHGAASGAAARALLARLERGEPAAGDPTLLPAHLSGTPATIDARFGAGFAAQLTTAPLSRWSGPHASTFGYHLVWREPATAPSPDARVATDWAHDQREADLRRAIETLVAQRRLMLREVAP